MRNLVLRQGHKGIKSEDLRAASSPLHCSLHSRCFPPPFFSDSTSSSLPFFSFPSFWTLQALQGLWCIGKRKKERLVFCLSTWEMLIHVVLLRNAFLHILLTRTASFKRDGVLFLPLSSSLMMLQEGVGWMCSTGALFSYCPLNNCLTLHLGEQHFTLLFSTFLTDLPSKPPSPRVTW